MLGPGTNTTLLAACTLLELTICMMGFIIVSIEMYWHIIWGVLCQRQVSTAGTSYYIPHILWDVIIRPCACYQLLPQPPSCNPSTVREQLLSITVLSIQGCERHSRWECLQRVSVTPMYVSRCFVRPTYSYQYVCVNYWPRGFTDGFFSGWNRAI